MQRMLFIFNPNTGGGRLKNHLLDILCRFSQAGYEVTVSPTGKHGDAKIFAQEKAPGYDIVVCCGGDGTLNEVVEGLLQCENPPPLGYIPGGTTNDFATSLELPKNDILEAAERIIHPREKFLCDVGVFNDRIFNYIAAFGAFTDVSYNTPQKNKNVMGYFAYIVEALSRLPSIQPFRIRVEHEEGEIDEEFIFGMVTNSSSVGGFEAFGRDKIQLDDGVFEMLLVRQPHNLADLGALSGALLSKNPDSPFLTIMRVKHVSILSETPLAWTLDGEFGGEVQEATISVHQKALAIYI